jgi:hypothetical protein
MPFQQLFFKKKINLALITNFFFHHNDTHFYLFYFALAYRFTALRLAQRETDTTSKRNHNRVKRDTSSVQTWVVCEEHFVNIQSDYTPPCLNTQ